MEKDLPVEDSMGCCVVWTSIPPISWIVPAIGHVGVTDSQGKTYDFAGSFNINKGKMAFGAPSKKWKIDIDPAVWDAAIAKATEKFASIEYNFFGSNCHYFAASVLDEAEVAGAPFSHGWSALASLNIAISLIIHSRPISIRDFFRIYVPFALFCLVLLHFIK